MTSGCVGVHLVHCVRGFGNETTHLLVYLNAQCVLACVCVCVRLCVVVTLLCAQRKYRRRMSDFRRWWLLHTSGYGGYRSSSSRFGVRATGTTCGDGLDAFDAVTGDGIARKRRASTVTDVSMASSCDAVWELDADCSSSSFPGDGDGGLGGVGDGGGGGGGGSSSDSDRGAIVRAVSYCSAVPVTSAGCDALAAAVVALLRDGRLTKRCDAAAQPQACASSDSGSADPASCRCCGSGASVPVHEPAPDGNRCLGRHGGADAAGDRRAVAHSDETKPRDWRPRSVYATMVALFL